MCGIAGIAAKKELCLLPGLKEFQSNLIEQQYYVVTIVTNKKHTGVVTHWGSDCTS